MRINVINKCEARMFPDRYSLFALPYPTLPYPILSSPPTHLPTYPHTALLSLGAIFCRSQRHVAAANPTWVGATNRIEFVARV